MLKFNALMIKSVDYADNDKILTLFSLEQGVISAKIRGVKKAGAKLKFAAEPFCFAEYMLTEGRLKSVANASLIDSFYPLREDLFRYYAAGTVAEFIRKFCPENVVHAALFLKTVRVLKDFAYTAVPAYAALLHYLAAATKEIGYSLRFGGCACCGATPSRPFFDFTEGNVCCESCRKEGSAEMSRGTYELFQALSETEELTEEAFSRYNIDRVYYEKGLRLIGRYLRTVAEPLDSLTQLLGLYGAADK